MAKKKMDGPKQEKQPAILTCRLDSARGGEAFLVLGSGSNRPGASYRLSGWMEMEYSPSHPSRLNLGLANLTATLTDQEVAGVPAWFHIAAGASRAVDRDGRINVPAEVAYAGLESVRKRLNVSRGHLPFVKPMPGRWSFSVLPDLAAQTLYAAGILNVAELLPFAQSQCALFFNITCTIAAAAFCRQLCLDIKFGRSSGEGVVSSPQLEGIIRKVDGIWGCSLRSQCCIHIKIGRQSAPGGNPNLKDTVNVREDRLTDDFDQTASVDRAPAIQPPDKSCYDLYLVNHLKSRVGEPHLNGITSYEPSLRASLRLTITLTMTLPRLLRMNSDTLWDWPEMPKTMILTE